MNEKKPWETGASIFLGRLETEPCAVFCGPLRQGDQHLLSGAAPCFDELKRLDENIFPFLLVFDIFLF
jgi:hypothetical protein